MLKRFVAVFGLVLLYMAVLATILLVVFVLAQDDETLMLIAFLVAFVLGIAIFIPYLNWATKRAFRFRGEGEPVPEGELRSQIQTINEFEAPVMIQERKGKLVATWKYVDARWWEILAKAGLENVYELHIKLDESRHRATLLDVTRSVSWRAGPGEVRIGRRRSQGVSWRYEVGKQWGIKENLELGKIYDYRFVSDEIKMPIMNSILRQGWDVQFALW
jgi:hypothetical protein